MLKGVSSPVLADTLDAVFVGRKRRDLFKPDARVYELVGQKVRLHAHRKCVCIVQWLGCSGGNGHLAATTAWVNRAGEPLDRCRGNPFMCCRNLNGIQNWQAVIMAPFHQHVRGLSLLFLPTKRSGALTDSLPGGINADHGGFDYALRTGNGV